MSRNLVFVIAFVLDGFSFIQAAWAEQAPLAMNRAALAAAADEPGGDSDDKNSPPDDVVCIGASRVDADPGVLELEQCSTFSSGPGGSIAVGVLELNYTPRSLGGKIKLFVGVPNGIWQQQSNPGAKPVSVLAPAVLVGAKVVLFNLDDPHLAGGIQAEVQGATSRAAYERLDVPRYMITMHALLTWDFGKDQRNSLMLDVSKDFGGLNEYHTAATLCRFLDGDRKWAACGIAMANYSLGTKVSIGPAISFKDTLLGKEIQYQGAVMRDIHCSGPNYAGTCGTTFMVGTRAVLYEVPQTMPPLERLYDWGARRP